MLTFSASLSVASPPSAALDVPKASAAPVIDGKLDDPAWEIALKLSNFRTFKPDFGKDPSQNTEAYVLCDAGNLYFAVRAYDKSPEKIKASISKRDGMFQDDYICILIDAFNNRQEAYGFLVNPRGVQGDGVMNASGNLEATFDTIWYSKGQIDDQGFTVEIRIPLKSIRFPSKKTVTMGLVVIRQQVRTSESSSFPALHPEQGGILLQTQPVSLTGLKYKRVVELLPALTHSQRYGQDAGALRRNENKSDLSLTAKVGLTSEITVDGTYNPDFSQIEADAGQVDFNLRYALYYPEKRPFFLENNDIFQFAGAIQDTPLVSIVYTRTIVDPAFGFKVTGKLGPKNMIAAIYSRDDVPYSAVDTHPDFSILRFKHGLAGDSYVGGFYTAKSQSPGFNRVAGSDGRIRLSAASVAEYHLFGSFTRPRGPGTTLNGYAAALKYSYDTRTVHLETSYQEISKNFEVDTGFLTRTGLRSLNLFSMYTFYPKSSFFQKIEPFYWSQHKYDTFFNMFETLNLFTLRFNLPRSSEFRLDGLLANEVYLGKKFNRSAFGFQGFTQLSKQIYLNCLFRRGGEIFYDPTSPYQGFGNTASLALDYQATQKLDLLLSLVTNDFYRESDKAKIYSYAIVRSRSTYQLNKYLFFRAILEYNDFRKRMTVDTLVSFTYIPGTVMHIGYGSAFEQLAWNGREYVSSRRFLETQRGLFFKVSYLWRF